MVEISLRRNVITHECVSLSKCDRALCLRPRSSRSCWFPAEWGKRPAFRSSRPRKRDKTLLWFPDNRHSALAFMSLLRLCLCLEGSPPTYNLENPHRSFKARVQRLFLFVRCVSQEQISCFSVTRTREEHAY